jgi:hypothetical protein
MATTLSCHGTIPEDTAQPAVKPFFLSQSNPPIILKKFFENELAEASLWHLHFIMSIVHTNIQELVGERNSGLKILTVLQSLLQHRIEEGLLSLKTQEILIKVKKDGLEKETDLLCKKPVLCTRCVLSIS